MYNKRTTILIFLDMDGVFNSGKKHEEYVQAWTDGNTVEDYLKADWSDNWVQPSIVERFKKCVEGFGISLICISAWAINQTRCHKEFDHYVGLHLLGALHGGSDRATLCEEIAGQRKFIVIDDSDNFYPDNYEPLINVNGRYGFTDNDALILVEKLKALS